MDMMEAGTGTARIQGTMHANHLDQQALAAWRHDLDVGSIRSLPMRRRWPVRRSWTH